MQQKVFISRELSSESIFLEQLQMAGFEVIGRSLVAFQAVPFQEIPKTDWIFFYSKQSVHFFFEGLQQAGLKITAKLATLGEGTAKALQEQLYLADFVGTGNPPHTAAVFSLLAKGQRVLFPRAAQSLLSIQKLLEGKIEALDLIVYNNQPLTNFELPRCDWLVFTSPMNAAAYFAKYDLQQEQQILAIGPTTARFLKQLGIENVKTAEEPSELALVQVIRAATRP